MFLFSIEKPKIKTNVTSSDSDDNLPLSKMSKHKKLKRKHRTEQPPKVEEEEEKVPIAEAPKSTLDYSKMLEKMIFKRSIEECDERGCSYSDHYPQSHTPVVHRVLDTQECNNCPGPSGNNSSDVKVEQWFSSSESYTSD